MNKTIYIRTNDETRLIAVPRNIEEGDVQIVAADAVPSHAFNLTNTLKASAMREARAIAKAAGLKLSNAQQVAWF